jgi:hypothetical protein
LLIKSLFELSYSIIEISKKIDINETKVRNFLIKEYSQEQYKKICAMNSQARIKRRKGMLNTDEILNNNRILLSEIIEKVKENKIDELSEENLFYAKVLFRNGLITKNGEVTQEGIDTLYQ